MRIFRTESALGIKTAKKIVADPHVPESKWLPAAMLLCQSGITIDGERNKADVSRLPFLLLLALFAGYGAARWVSMGFDWGYYATKALQESGGFFSCLTGNDMSQGIAAAFAGVYMLPLVCFGGFLGMIRAVFSKHVWISFLLPVIAIVVYGSIALFTDSSFDQVDMLWLTVGTGLAYLSYGTSWYLSRRFVVARSLLPMIGTYSLVGAIFVFDLVLQSCGHDNQGIFALLTYPVKLVLYAAFLSLTAACGAYFSLSNKRTGSTFAGSLSCFSVLLCCLGNWLFNMGSLFMDKLGWGANLGISALFSASIILLISVLSVFLGLMFGRSTNRRISLKA